MSTTNPINHQCPNCGHRFNIDEWIRTCPKEAMVKLETPNTLTSYTDIGQPRVRCPHCKQVMLDRDYDEPLQT